MDTTAARNRQGGRGRLRPPAPLVVLLGIAALLAGLTAAVACGAKETVDAAAAAGKVAAERQGCVACHSVDGRIGFGPTWKGLYRSTLKFTDGTSAVADEDYLRESINNPTAKVIQGWQPTMPGRLPTSSEEVEALIAYIRSLK